MQYHSLRNTLLLCGLASLAALTMAANTDNIDYSKFELDGPVGDMMWCGPSNEVILVLTERGSVYRSRDRGSQWRKLQQVMQ